MFTNLPAVDEPRNSSHATIDTLDRQIDGAGRALRHIERALTLLRPIDLDVYWNLAATACDAADDLRACLSRLADDNDLRIAGPLDDTCLAPHRATIFALRPHCRPLGPSASASALDMVALARNLLLPRDDRTTSAR